MKFTLFAAGILSLGIGFAGYRAMGGTGMAGCCGGGSCTTNAAATAPSTEPTTQKAVYVCSMDSDVASDKPGKCPKCGMDLVKK